MKRNAEIVTEQKIIFEINDDTVFETALATLQFSIIGT